MEIKFKLGINTLISLIGLIGVWHFSHSWWAVGFAAFGAIHLSKKVDNI